MGSFDWVAEEFLSSKSVFVAFDLETTGLDAKKERIVELGAIKFDNRGPIARFGTLINPLIPIPPEATRVNGISDAMLKNMPTLDEVLPDFVRFIRGSTLIAHNAGFDCGFINAALALRWEDARRQDRDLGQASLLDMVDDGVGDGETKKAVAAWIPPYASLPNRIVDTIALAKEAFPALPGISCRN
ncbi:hypothetical protein MASR2M78_25670 [Treponema sp.]